MIRKFLKRLVLGERADSESFIRYLRKQGIRVGKNVRFYSPVNTLVDVTNPWLLSIGDNVNVTHGVIILTHDYSWAVMKQLDDSAGEIIGAQSPVKIGNNVFIGMNAIITRGVTIGNNVVIGAGSIVTHDCESNSVYAGNPAKKIMTIEQFREKRRKRLLQEAQEVFRAYWDEFGEDPDMSIFTEYFPLFCTMEQAVAVPVFRRQMATGGNYDACVARMENVQPLFESYKHFLEYCKETSGRKE